MSGSTIAAVATAPGRGGVAVIRVSGPDAFLVAERLTGWHSDEVASFPYVGYHRFFSTLPPFHPSTLPLLHSSTPPPFHSSTPPPFHPSTLPPLHLDTGLLLAFRAPRSYTGEDVVEFQCHGGTVTPSRVLAACFAAGAVAARRGEFTERAFLNGKMDLSEAESVIELVDAKTARAADDALARQVGAKKATYRALYERALALSAELEHALDVDEEELPADFMSVRAAQAEAIAESARLAAGSADAGRLLRDGALVVLAGAPNAGKSSLLNALCGEDRAIVSPTPGTTRDTIEAWIDLDGWPVRLVDTAGLRETGDAIEAEGVRRAEALLAQADVVVALDCDIDRPSVLPVHAKCDLDTPGRARIPAAPRPVSAKTGAGLAELRAAIIARLVARAGATAEDGATASERERALLLAAARQLDVRHEGERQETGDERGRETRDDEFHCRPRPPTSTFLADPVLLANAVRAAAETLGALVGATYSSDLLDTLFSRFCVGK